MEGGSHPHLIKKPQWLVAVSFRFTKCQNSGLNLTEEQRRTQDSSKGSDLLELLVCQNSIAEALKEE